MIVASAKAMKVGGRVIRTGDIVRFLSGKTSGPIWKPSGDVRGRPRSHRTLKLPGYFVVRDIQTQRKRSNSPARVYLDVIGIDKTAGACTVFIGGKNYERHGIVWRPYRVVKKRTKKKVTSRNIIILETERKAER